MPPKKKQDKSAEKLPVDKPFQASDDAIKDLKEELLAETAAELPMMQTATGEEVSLLDIVERLDENVEVSAEIRQQVDDDFGKKTKAKPKGKKGKKKAAEDEDVDAPDGEVVKDIPVPKLNLTSWSSLQSEIQSVTLQQGLVIQRARRVYPTGCVGVDVATGKKDPIKGNGGFPELTVAELYGPTGVRKSNFAEQLGFNILEDDPENIVVFLYTEDPDLERLHRECIKRGLPLDTIGNRFQILGLYNPETPDAKLQTAERRLMDLVIASRYDNVKLIVIDSLKALVSVTQMFKKAGAKKKADDDDDDEKKVETAPQAGKKTGEQIKPFEDEEVAIRAKLMEKLFNRILFQRRSAILLMTNQLTEKIPNVMDRFKIQTGQDRTPAGTMKEFLSMIRIFVQGKPLYEEEKLKIGADKDSEHCPQAGILQFYKIKKNRWGRPNIKVVVPFDFNTGDYDRSLEVLTIGTHLGLIRKGGSNFYFGEDRCPSKNAALEYLDAHPDVREAIYLKIIEYGPQLYQIRPGDERAATSVTDIIEPGSETVIGVEPILDPESGEVTNATEMLAALQSTNV